MAVPKSGSKKTSSTGTAPMPSAPTTEEKDVTALPRVARKPATEATTTTLPSSDGWSWKKPRLIQR